QSHSPYFFSTIWPPPQSTLFPYTTLFRSRDCTGSWRISSGSDSRRPAARRGSPGSCCSSTWSAVSTTSSTVSDSPRRAPRPARRSEEQTSELQSRGHLVCRLLLEKKKKNN